MLYFINSCFITIFAFFLFFLFGKNYYSITQQEHSLISAVGIGFFIYYGLFQLVALPCIFLKSSLSLLSIIWAIVLLLMLTFFIFNQTKKHKTQQAKNKSFTHPSFAFLWENAFCFVIIIMVLFQCYFASLSYYSGWDTAYYIGTIKTSLYTDTMYIYNGTSGIKEEQLVLRYALSSFYMNSAVWCKWFNFDAIPMHQYTINMICQIMTNIFVYLIGKSLWNSKLKICIFMCINIICNFFFVTTYSSAGFLLDRGYEAKAFCANVLVLATIYSVMELRKDTRDLRKWTYVFLIVSASIPISMSAILLIPVLFVILISMLFYEKRDARILRYGIICLIPNILYVLIYFLNAKGWLIIKV